MNPFWDNDIPSDKVDGIKINTNNNSYKVRVKDTNEIITVKKGITLDGYFDTKSIQIYLYNELEFFNNKNIDILRGLINE